MQTATFLSTPKIVAGIGVIDSLGAQLAGFGKKPLLLIGSQSLRKNGTLARIETAINGEYALFENIASDPDIEIVEAGAAAYQKNHCDYLIAVGGGSVLDAAKAIGLLATSGGKIEDYETKAPTRPLPPLVAIPTTAGTGSEVTKFTIITDTKRKKKMALGHEYLMPSMAVLDPNLTLSMPRHVTAATGMDALTHAIEAYISDKASVMTDIWALKAIELITKNLLIAVYDPENLAARFNMLYGQLFAGIAFNNSSVALVHAMSRPLGAYYGIAHGQANAMLLPAVMKYNQKVCATRYQRIAAAMGILSPTKSLAQTAGDVVNFVDELFNDLPLKRRLSEFHVAEEDLAKMAHDAYVNGSAKVNPRKALQNEVVAIYRSIY